MKYTHAKRLYRLVFLIVAVPLAILAYQPIGGWWDDSLGAKLRDNHRAKLRNFDVIEHNRILAEEGKEAAFEFRIMPKRYGESAAMRRYADWAWALVLITIVGIGVTGYFFIWAAGSWCYRYVKHDPKDHPGPNAKRD
ncbi:MAG: hypothetical protein ACI9TH_004025 [Kiritimatiellia bacterium]|jgi:hypothetical protein